MKQRFKLMFVALILISMISFTLLLFWFVNNSCLVDCDYHNSLDMANVVTYECTNGGKLVATYDKNKYSNLKAYVGNNIIFFPRLTKVGSIYSATNSTNSVEFWSEGDANMTTYVKEKGIITYKCKFLTSGE